MTTLVFSLMVIFGILFIISVLLMAPKGGLGFGVGGMSTSNEYGSKKSIEGTLKKTALISIIIFTVLAIIYPYLAKKELSTGKAVKTAPVVDGVKIDGVNTNDVKIKTQPVEVNNNAKEDNNIKENNNSNPVNKENK